jgi:hypothetical protein
MTTTPVPTRTSSNEPLEIRDINVSGGELRVGETVQVNYRLVNVSSQSIAIAKIPGTLQHWIERLGDDSSIPPIPRQIARSGNKYAAGGYVARLFLPDTPAVLEDGAGVNCPTKSIDTQNYPPGRYRCTIEYKDGSRIYQTEQVEFELLGIAARQTIASQPPPAVAASGEYPLPQLRFVEVDKQSRCNLTVENWRDYPNELFVASPDLPPIGLNTKASRTIVSICGKDGRHIYGFVAFGASSDLTKLWFGLGTKQIDEVYIVLTDRRTGKTYKSNSVTIPR